VRPLAGRRYFDFLSRIKLCITFPVHANRLTAVQAGNNSWKYIGEKLCRRCLDIYTINII